MRTALIGLLLLAALAACEDTHLLPAQRKEFVCKPCNGDGPNMALSTPLPVPVAAYVTYDLCFTASDPDACWYGCPGPLEESYNRGAELCGGRDADRSE